MGGDQQTGGARCAGLGGGRRLYSVRWALLCLYKAGSKGGTQILAVTE